MLATQSATQFDIIAVTLVPVLFLGAISLGRWLKRKQNVKLGLSYLLFCAVLSLYAPLMGFGARLLGPEHSAYDELRLQGVLRNLGAAFSILGAFVLLALIKRYFWELWFEKRQKTAAPKFLSQIVGLIIVVATVLSVISIAYGKDLTAFVFGSTVVVGIIGFAMQDLLGNIIAGIALELGKPFKMGDWLQVEGHRAEVIEVNWRSTRLRTRDDVYLDLPNKGIVGATITNLSFPTKQHAIRIRIGFDYNVPPNFVKDCLVRAATRAFGVLQQPPPKAFLCDFGDSAIVYEIKCWIDQESHFSEISDAIRTNVWYEAQRNNIRIPFPIRTVQIERPEKQSTDFLETARTYLRKQPFLQCLDQTQADHLLKRARVLRFGRAESLITQGEKGQSMFFLLRGELEVSITVGLAQKPVASLVPGDYFGEMSLLTGEPRSATVVAQTDCEVWEIDKTLFAEVLAGNDNLLQKLSELLAARRLETEGILTAQPSVGTLNAKRREYTAGILNKLYSFFEL